MNSIESLLGEAGRQFEPEIQSRLKGMLGGIIQSYLPQVWVFQTEDETASLLVDKMGVVTVVEGAAPRPDVTVEIPRVRLVAALTTRNKASVPPGPLTVTPHTVKGKTAFDYLRGRLGL
jgi:hypothetical protein